MLSRMSAVLLAFALCSRAWAAEEQAICMDGTTSKGGRGACSGHGGVDKDATKAAADKAKAAKAEEKAKAKAEAKEKPAAKSASAKKEEGEHDKNDPTGAIAKCKDGTYSHAKGHQGACSRHGGVAEWLDEKK